MFQLVRCVGLAIVAGGVGACDRGVPWTCDCVAAFTTESHHLVDASSEEEAIEAAKAECNGESEDVCSCRCDPG